MELFIFDTFSHFNIKINILKRQLNLTNNG